MRGLIQVGVLAAAALLGVGCGSESSEPSPPTSTAAGADAGAAPAPVVERARCPEGLADCVSATGTIVYVERIDPDGDGDAHFVLISSESVTAPGITVVDVRRDLRPHPLPRPGDELSAAGPVFEGSYGQRQIQAEVVTFARRIDERGIARTGGG